MPACSPRDGDTTAMGPEYELQSTNPESEHLMGPEKHDSQPETTAEEVFRHGVDADEALKAILDGNPDELVIDEETNRRLLRKIDMNIMPLLCVVYGLNYLDKTTLSYASIMGLKPDLKLEKDNYQWLGSVFYFGYLAWEYPTNRLLQRLPLAKYSAFNMIMWGLVLSLLATTSNFSGALAVRFFLGLFEAAVTPGFAFFTSQWYTKREQGFRTGIWFSFNGFGSIFGSVVAYGIAKGNIEHGFSLAPWKILFVFTGVLTASLGILFWFIMPDNQLNAWFLTKEERIMAVVRIRENGQGIGNKHFKMYQVKEALSDPMVWAFAFLAVVADIPNGGITNFFSQLIEGFGYDQVQSLLYSAPGGAVEVVALIVNGYLGDRYGHRILIGSSGVLISILGMALIAGLPHHLPSGRLAGYYLTQTLPTAFVSILSLISTNIAGYTKKTTVAAIYLVSYCVGNIIGPQVFRPKDAPDYIPAIITILVCYALCFVDMLFIYWYYARMNKRKALTRAQPEYIKLENQEFLDLTDRENPEFVYTL